MKNSIHTLLTTILAYFRRTNAWQRRLVELYEEHGSHAFVRDIVEVMALARYQSNLLNEEQRLDLERFLIDFHTKDAAGIGVAKRQAVRSQVLGDLRKS